jgi:hypothetical protein
MVYGTLQVSDLLATTTTTVADFGEDRAFQAIELDLAAHNALLLDKERDLVERTTERLLRFGSNDSMTMDEIDEYGTPDAQKVSAGQNVGLPLRRYGLSVQWTRHWFQNHTPAELAAQFVAAQDADAKIVDRELKRAIFNPTNFTFTDRLVDNNAVDLAVKRLVNADSAAIPVSPSGTTFNGATHTHYLATAGASLAAADLTGLIQTVVEHYAAGEPRVYINKAQESTVRALTGFVAYVDARIIPATSAASATGVALDRVQIYNRAIGIYEGAEVWVKPWVPANYLFAFVAGAPKTLGRRSRRAQGDALVIEADDEAHPLRARVMAREVGFGVLERTNGAVLFITAGGTYTAPTIT